MTEATNPASEQVEIVHISEADFRSLPRSVRMLMSAYSKPVPSWQAGLIVLEFRAYRWPEIDSEVKKVAGPIHSLPERGSLKKTVRYLNDYECPREGAAWSRVGCASTRTERCPVCRRKVKPIETERYLVVEWKPARPSLFSRLFTRLRVWKLE